jgi:hypothetical protein
LIRDEKLDHENIDEWDGPGEPMNGTLP